MEAGDTLDLALSGQFSADLYQPVVYSNPTSVDDGPASYVQSLDDSRQFKDGSGILWSNATVRSNVFFKIFKGLDPDIQINDRIEIYPNEAFNMDIILDGRWNGVRKSRRDQVLDSPAMPAVNGPATASFINSSGVAVVTLDMTVNNGQINFIDYSNVKLIPDTYDVKVTYTAPTSNQQYTDSVKTIEDVLTVKPKPTYTVTFKVANGSWNDGSGEEKKVQLTGTDFTRYLQSAQIPAVGNMPDTGYKAGRWSIITPFPDTKLMNDITYTYIYSLKRSISTTVTFEVVNGALEVGSTTNKTVTFSGLEGDIFKLDADQIPAVGNTPDLIYKAGSWDVTPDTETQITGNTTYTYTYAPREPISQNVTFKVVNGAWDDGNTGDITATLNVLEGDALKLAADQIPAVGTMPDAASKPIGAWNITPDTDTEITGDTTYTYTYQKKDTISRTVTFKVVNGAWDDGAFTDKTVMDGEEADQNPSTGIAMTSAAILMISGLTVVTVRKRRKK